MKEIELDLHDEESSFDTEKEVMDCDFGNILDDDEEENYQEKDLIFYRRLEDY